MLHTVILLRMLSSVLNAHSGRAAMREILADMIGRAPAEVELVEDAQGQLRVANLGEREPIEVAIAYAGIWIVIGVSKSSLGLATSVPTLPDRTIPACSRFVQRGRLFARAALRRRLCRRGRACV